MKDLLTENLVCGGLREQGIHKSNSTASPLVSIITVVFNGASMIEATIDSIRSQDYGNIEYIICDGGSNDGTIEILNANTQAIDYWISQPDKGLYNAMNKGINLAKGTWVMFLGSDDYLSSINSISNLVQATSLNPSASLVFGNVEMSNGKVFVNDLNWKIFFENTIHHQGVMYHQRLFESFRYNDDFKACSDYELNLICFLSKEAVIGIDSTVSYFRLAGVSSAKDNNFTTQEFRKIRKKHLGLVGNYVLIILPRLMRLIGTRYKSQFVELTRSS